MRRLTLLVLALVQAACFTTVDTTEHCVGVRYGQVTEQKMAVGLNLTILTDAQCFSLQEQNYPRRRDEVEAFSAATRDPVEITGKLSAVYRFQNVPQLFLDKRDASNAEIQMHNALKDAITTATAMFTIDDMFGPHRSAFNDSVKAIAQRKAGPNIQFVNVYLTDVKPPESIAAARVVSAQKETELQAARNQLRIDSAEARGTIIKAEANARRQEMESRALATSPAVLQLRAAEAMAAGLKDICQGTQTCIIGGNVLDKYLNAVRP